MMMVVGLATVAGSTMVAYALILKATLPNAAGHALVASIISAPAGVLLSRIIVPEKEGEGGAVADYNSSLKYRQRHRRHFQGHIGRPDGGNEYFGHPHRLRVLRVAGQHPARHVPACGG